MDAAIKVERDSMCPLELELALTHVAALHPYIVVSQVTDACASSKRSGTAREMSAPHVKQFLNDLNILSREFLVKSSLKVI